MQIIIQKKYLIIVEISENIYRVFLIVVNFVFNIVQKVSEGVDLIFNYFKDKFFKKELLKKVYTGYTFNYVKSDFVIYSNLLAPPLFK